MKTITEKKSNHQMILAILAQRFSSDFFHPHTSERPFKFPRRLVQALELTPGDKKHEPSKLIITPLPLS
jgi:hypothetical protein